MSIQDEISKVGSNYESECLRKWETMKVGPFFSQEELESLKIDLLSGIGPGLLDSRRLIQTIEDLWSAIRAHRDADGHELCWLNSVELYQHLPEKTLPSPTVPPIEEFLAKCQAYRESLEGI